jgi:hypothetical protein
MTSSAPMHSTDGSRPLDGVYVICTGARSHTESLILRRDTFQHFIQTHGPGRRSAGTFTMYGDTLVLDIRQSGPVRPTEQRPTRSRNNFVMGKYADWSVLWRGASAAKRAEAHPFEMSEYAALFYGGPDPARPQVPSCGEVRRRLEARQHIR